MKKHIYYTICFLLLFPLISGAQPEDQILTTADQMPYFPGCEDFEDGTEEKRRCSDINLINFISKNIVYPDVATEEGLQGTVLVSFIINEKGVLLNPELLRDIGGGCGAAALRVVLNMPNWEPAYHNGQPVKVRLNLPIRFSLTPSTNAIAARYKIIWGTIKGNSVQKKLLKENITVPIAVRDELGNDIDISRLRFIFEKRRTYLERSSHGHITLQMERVIRKVKSGGVFRIIATIQVDGNFVDIIREFEVVK